MHRSKLLGPAAAAALALLSLSACDGTDTPDGGHVDARSPADAGSGDAGATDAGPADAGATDAGGMDAGGTDAGAPDAGAPDAGAPDAGAPDTGTADAGAGDAGEPDAGPPPPRYVDCDSSRTCATGFVCEGYVESLGLGKCVPTAVPPGEGEECSALDDCGDDLLCGGYTRGFGLCLPAWMRASFSDDGLDEAIPDGSSAGLARTLTVYGIATVDMDVLVDVVLEHPAPSELRITLTNPDGTVAVVYDGADESDPPGRLVIEGPVFGFSGDERVNGAWTLTLVDDTAGNAGTLESWRLTVASRYD